MGSLIHVAAWERVSPWRRALAAFVRVMILLLIVVTILHFAYRKRYQLEAKIWHWRHGYSTRVGNYSVPVPEHWLILIQNSTVFTLVNTNPTLPRRDDRFRTTALITVYPFRRGPVGASQMESWLVATAAEAGTRRSKSCDRKEAELR